MTTITVTLKSSYSNRSTTVRAKVRTSESGKYEIAEISRRQFNEARKRCCYAGTDYPRVIPVEGFGEFSDTADGGMSALRRIAV